MYIYKMFSKFYHCPTFLRFLLFLFLYYCFFFSVIAPSIVTASSVSSGQIGPTYCVVPGQMAISAREWEEDKLLQLINSARRWL